MNEGDRHGLDAATAERLLRGEAIESEAAAPLIRLLAAAAGPLAVDPARAEARQAEALAAFRAAREAGRRPRDVTRRGDDWRHRTWWGVRRPRGRAGRPSGPVRVLTALAVVAAVGGITVATGSGAIPLPFGPAHGPAHPVAPGSGPGEPGGPGPMEPSTAPSAKDSGPRAGEAGESVPPGASEEEQSPAGLCRAYERASGDGTAMDATAFQRLVAAAGGRSAVGDYCERIGEQGKPRQEKEDSEAEDKDRDKDTKRSVEQSAYPAKDSGQPRVGG